MERYKSRIGAALSEPIRLHPFNGSQFRERSKDVRKRSRNNFIEIIETLDRNYKRLSELAPDQQYAAMISAIKGSFDKAHKDALKIASAEIESIIGRIDPADPTASQKIIEMMIKGDVNAAFGTGSLSSLLRGDARIPYRRNKDVQQIDILMHEIRELDRQGEKFEGKNRRLASSKLFDHIIHDFAARLNAGSSATAQSVKYKAMIGQMNKGLTVDDDGRETGIDILFRNYAKNVIVTNAFLTAVEKSSSNAGIRAFLSNMVEKGEVANYSTYDPTYKTGDREKAADLLNKLVEKSGALEKMVTAITDKNSIEQLAEANYVHLEYIMLANSAVGFLQEEQRDLLSANLRRIDYLVMNKAEQIGVKYNYIRNLALPDYSAQILDRKLDVSEIFGMWTRHVASEASAGRLVLFEGTFDIDAYLNGRRTRLLAELLEVRRILLDSMLSRQHGEGTNFDFGEFGF